MVHAKRNGTSNGHALKILKPGRKRRQVSSYGSMAKRIFDNLVSEGIDEIKAWRDAGNIAFDGYSPLTDSGNCHLVSTVNTHYTGTPGNGNMIKAVTKRKAPKRTTRDNTFDLPEGVFINVPLPAGNDLEQRVARGIARFAERQKLTIPKLCKEYKLQTRLIYRLLKGNKPQTAILNFKKVSSQLGITSDELLNLGTAPP